MALASVKAPFFMAEELRFDQGFGDGGAVDRHEGRSGGTVVMNRLGHQVLARAALALDQDGAGLHWPATL